MSHCQEYEDKDKAECRPKSASFPPFWVRVKPRIGVRFKTGFEIVRTGERLDTHLSCGLARTSRPSFCQGHRSSNGSKSLSHGLSCSHGLSGLRFGVRGRRIRIGLRRQQLEALWFRFLMRRARRSHKRSACFCKDEKGRRRNVRSFPTKENIPNERRHAHGPSQSGTVPGWPACRTRQGRNAMELPGLISWARTSSSPRAITFGWCSASGRSLQESKWEQQIG